jgi:aminoglycoside/choline kinase family phosphotransferase
MRNVELVPASSDASFRRYFRIRPGNSESFIVMDAPPEREDCRPFIHVANLFAGVGLNVPRVLDADLDKGILLLTDLGNEQYLQTLTTENVDRLYGDAMAALLTLQARVDPAQAQLPMYDRQLLMTEMQLFADWLLGRHLGLTLSDSEQQLLAETFQQLAGQALAQPQVAVHRDYHSRNLMLLEGHNPGILDFQDAVVGPVSYDLVSLLRDCYIRWPADKVSEWLLGYHELALQSGVLQGVDEEDFKYWFDTMGMQRHLKASGIFARLYHRDSKAGYLADIPRTLDHLLAAAAEYPAFSSFHGFVQERVRPCLDERGELTEAARR